MLEKYLDDYIDTLLERENRWCSPEQCGLYSKKDYYKLLKPVIDLVSNYKDFSLDELRNKLYEQSGIVESITDFIYNREMVPGLVFSYGTNNYRETIIVGNKQEVTLDKDGKLVPAVEAMSEDTIFDLASVTKLFTSLSILKLVENGSISLDDQVTKYRPEFKNLQNITIFDLLSFGVPLKTNGRIDRAQSREEAEALLFNIEIDKESIGSTRNPYTDMGAMILKYVIESVSGINYYDFIDQNILTKLGLKDTHVIVPQMKLDRVASTNYDGKLYKDGNFSMSIHANGIVYDAKAQILGSPQGDLTGHAGLFSTNEDMTNLAKGLINGQIIDDKYIEMMATNRTGRSYETEDGQKKYVQYLGMLCYSKNPILADSELFHAMSGKALASAGWTGTQLTVDPVNELYFFMAGNRSHNRMTFIDSTWKDKVEIDERGKKTIILPDGSTKIDATRFAWDRDSAVVHPSLKLAIQYKMLEDIYSFDKNGIKEAHNQNVKHL